MVQLLEGSLDIPNMSQIHAQSALRLSLLKPQLVDRQCELISNCLLEAKTRGEEFQKIRPILWQLQDTCKNL